MLKLPPASHHVKRYLQPRELQSIAVALELLAITTTENEELVIARFVMGVDEILSDDELRALSFELTRARKVKVCRTKQRES